MSLLFVFISDWVQSLLRSNRALKWDQYIQFRWVMGVCYSDLFNSSWRYYFHPNLIFPRMYSGVKLCHKPTKGGQRLKGSNNGLRQGTLMSLWPNHAKFTPWMLQNAYYLPLHRSTPGTLCSSMYYPVSQQHSFVHSAQLDQGALGILFTINFNFLWPIDDHDASSDRHICKTCFSLIDALFHILQLH